MTLQTQTVHRLSTCHRHPTTKPITGFCASCLRERLSSVEGSASTNPTTSSPHLRRTNSYASNNPNVASTSQPCRKSCDVGPRNTLSNLFNIDDREKAKKKPHRTNLGLELKDENEGEFKKMKEFIDLEFERKNSSRPSFWESAASVFSKKLLKWKRKQQWKNRKENESLVEDNKSTATARPLRETESEIGLYGYLERRSCDTDPRLLIDNGRYSFDEPRASWDGYLIGKAYPRIITPMAIVQEKEKEKEKESLGNEGEKSPGGSEQTRDYYGESLSMQRRRKSFDRSNSGKRASLGDVDDVNKLSISNAKVSPETVGLFHGAKLLVTEKELRDSNWYSIKDYRAECVESDSKNVDYATGESNEKGFKFKKSVRRRNVWNMWGFIQKTNEGKCIDEEIFTGGKVNAADGPLAESWQKLKRVANGEASSTVSEKLIRSYSISTRNSFKVDGSFHGGNGVETKDNDGRKREEIVLPRDRVLHILPTTLKMAY